VLFFEELIKVDVSGGYYYEVLCKGNKVDVSGGYFYVVLCKGNLLD
jgi:hypothetical protein